MPALISQEQAMAHLRLVPPLADQQAVDLDQKIADASDIVIDYLKTRRIAIASISAANPAVVTTTVPHSLTDGASAVIADTTTTPSVTGAQVITVTGPTTFTIPVNVTAGQDSEAGTVTNSVWTDTTVPRPIRSAILLVLGHLWEHRGDDMRMDESLWEAVERICVRFRDPALA